MLYALIMAAIFSLILQFYLTLQVENQKNYLLEKRFLSAQIMAQLALRKGAKTMTFDKGKVIVNEKSVTVTFSDGKEISLEH